MTYQPVKYQEVIDTILTTTNNTGNPPVLNGGYNNYTVVGDHGGLDSSVVIDPQLLDRSMQNAYQNWSTNAVYTTTSDPERSPFEDSEIDNSMVLKLLSKKIVRNMNIDDLFKAIKAFCKECGRGDLVIVNSMKENKFILKFDTSYTIPWGSLQPAHLATGPTMEKTLRTFMRQLLERKNQLQGEENAQTESD